MEQRSPDPERTERAASLEEWIGKRWSTWAGAVALLFAAGFYLQLASGRGWIGPVGKIAIAIGAGLVAIFLGDRALRRDARVLGQGLTGAGLGTVFGALYAGHALYGLYGAELAAVALVAVTAAGMVIAVRRDSAPIAILAVLGGYLTPVLASDGTDPGAKRDALFSYLTVLDLGVLGVALARRWRALEWLAFAGTWALFAGWYHRTAEPEMFTTLAWCAGFFAIFLAVPLVYHLRKDVTLSRDRRWLVVLDAAFAFGFACEILDGDGTQLARVALVLAAVYAALAAVVRRRMRGDEVAYATFAVVATAFATLAAPLALRDEGISLAWAFEAPVLALLGTRYRLAIVRHAGAAVVLLAAGALLTTHVPLHEDVFIPFLNPEFGSAIAVAAAAALYGWLAHRTAVRTHDAFGRGAGIGSVVLGALLAFGLVHAEIWGAGDQVDAEDLALMAALGWQLVVTGALLLVARRTFASAWIEATVSATVAAFIAVAVVFLPPAGPVFANLRFLVLAATAATWLALRHVVRRLPAPEDPSIAELRTWLARIIPAVVTAAMLVVVSSEAWQHARLGIEDPRRAGWLGQMALSCAWSGFAAAALVAGFRFRWVSLRVFALLLFGVTAAKVMIVDLGRVEQIYRVASFLVLGVLLFAASWLYHRPGARR